MNQEEIILTAKKHLFDLLKDGDKKYQYLPAHLAQVELWANRLIKKNPDSDSFSILLSVWLHDIGNLIGDPEVDHAIKSEIEAREFLGKLGVDNSVIEKVAHSVRSHRCRDVQPNTLEAKILACADSASHMTDTVYIDFMNRGEVDGAKQKLERDYRDVSIFEELKNEITPLYETWNKMISLWARG